MADEILNRDENRVTVLGGVTDDSNQFIKMLRVDPTTKRLLVSADDLPSSGVNLYTALGSSLKGQTFGMEINNVTGNVGNLADGTLNLTAIVIPEASTITGVMWIQNTQGNYTADNYNGVGLYSYSSGTLTLQASSTNDGNIWKATAISLATKAFTTPYVATAGVYFIGALYNNSAQTTAPAFAGQSSNLFAGAVASLDFTNSAKIRGTVSAQTSLPATQAMSGVTAVTPYIWWAVY